MLKDRFAQVDPLDLEIVKDPFEFILFNEEGAGEGAGGGEGSGEVSGEGEGDGSGEGTGEGEGSGEGEGESAHWSDSFKPEDFDPESDDGKALLEKLSNIKDLEGLDDLLAKFDKPDVPEAYAAPEGVEIDKDTFESFGPVAKELGMSQAQMDGVVKFHSELMESMPTIMKDIQTEQFEAQHTELRKEMGEQPYNEMISKAKAVMQTIASDELWDYLGAEQSGLGNSPEIIKLFATVGKFLSEDTLSKHSHGSQSKSEGGLESIYDHPTSKHNQST